MKHHTPYKKSKINGWIIMLFLAVCLSNCSETNSDAPLSDAAHPRAWNNPKFLTSDIFHGMSVVQDGEDSCRTCHGSNLKGDNDIPGCNACHFGPDGSKTPEGSVWVHGQDQHGAYESFEPVCNNCHALERRYGLDPAACHNCHGEGINHVTGQAWLDKYSAQFHGDNADLNCADCHNLNTYCATCHFGKTGSKSPLGSGWVHGDNGDHRLYENSEIVCNQCHTLNRTYGNEPIACHDCHWEGVNHVTGQAWLDKYSAQFHGDNADLNCADCHNLNTYCATCHFGETGSKSPLGSGWVHGNNDDHRRYESSRSICNQCHALNRTYGNEPGRCHDCHDD